MATYTATQTGNWNNPATWGGVGVPTLTNDIAITSTSQVTVDGAFSISEIRTTSTGSFLLANGSSLTCGLLTGNGGITVGSTIPALQFTSGAGTSATFNGTILDMQLGTNFIAIQNSGAGTLNLNGNYNITTALLAANIRTCVSQAGTGITNIVGRTTGGTAFLGDVLSYSGASTITGGSALALSNGTVNITGVVSGGNVANTSTILQTGGVLNLLKSTSVTANSGIGGNTGYGLYVSAGTVNLNGDLTGGNVRPAVYNPTGSITINISGNSNLYASSTNPAIWCSQIGTTNSFSTQSIVNVGESTYIQNSNGVMAILATRLRMESTGTSWLYQTTPGAGSATWAVSTGGVTYPAVTDVRATVSYNGSTQTGTCIRPLASNVLQGVLVGSSGAAGTLIVTPTTMWSYPTNSSFTVGSIGERLKNATTESTQGAQVSAFNV